jgi:hypothetical protein
VKVTESVQLPAAGTLIPQLSVSAKSPPAVIEEIDSAELPMLRSKTTWGWLVEPTVSWANCKELGLRETDGADAVPIFITNASAPPPPNTLWYAPCVVGKSVEFVEPDT